MSKPITAASDTFSTWRTNLNTVSNNVGDPASITASDSGDSYTSADLLTVVNKLISLKVKRTGDTIGSLAVTGPTALNGNLTLNGVSGTSGQSLISNGVGNPPTWGSSTTITTTALGGTGSNLNVSAYGVAYRQTGSPATLAMTAAGAVDQLLVSGGSSAAPLFKTLTSTAGSVSITSGSTWINIESSASAASSTIDTTSRVGTNLLVGSLNSTGPNAHNNIVSSNALEVRPGFGTSIINLLQMTSDRAGGSPVFTVSTSGNTAIAGKLTLNGSSQTEGISITHSIADTFALDTFNVSSEFRAAKYTIFVRRGNIGMYFSEFVVASLDGVNTITSEYGVISAGQPPLTALSASISGGVMTLYAQQNIALSTDYRVVRTALLV